jgi:general secretion pathway protein J
MNKVKKNGFTLIEVLVAMGIFSILSALAYGTLNQTLITADILSNRMDKIQSLQRAIRLIEQDFMQLAKRPVRSEIGNIQLAALTTNPRNIYPIEFTRHGWSNPLSLKRSTLQRAAYALNGDALTRLHWNVLDKTYSNRTQSDIILGNVKSFNFSFMKNNNDWTEQWPPIEYNAIDGLKVLPKAVKITLTFNDDTDVYRLIEIK